MTTLNVRHVGIVTNNLKKSINFYSKILGFKIVKQMNETDPVSYTHLTLPTSDLV